MSGMRAAVLALLLVAARQEDTPSLDSLLDRLSDDPVELRDAAIAAVGRPGVPVGTLLGSPPLGMEVGYVPL